MRVHANSDRWQWLSDFFQRELGLDRKQFKKAVDSGSVRVNKALVLEDFYVGPGSKILTYLEPKAYKAPVTVINHPASSAKRVAEWKPKWNLVRKVSKNWLVVDKPAGISSISTRDFARGTLVPYWLRKYIPRSQGSSGILTTSRLDVGTHGLIVVGRNSNYVAKHNDIIEARKVRKRYTAVVTGWKRPHVRRNSHELKTLEWQLVPQWSVPRPSAAVEPSEDNPDTVPYEETMRGKRYLEKLAKMGPVASRCSDTPWRHLGLWEHYLPSRGHGEMELPDPEFGELTKNSARVGQSDHLRVPSARDFGPGYEVPVKLIIEAARPATPESVALRAFSRRWTERLIEQAERSGEPLYELDIELLTGKTHQIRTQLECEGLVIIGDWLYGSPYLPDPNAFALCCRSLEWVCPMERKPVSIDLRNPDTSDVPPL